MRHWILFFLSCLLLSACASQLPAPDSLTATADAKFALQFSMAQEDLKAQRFEIARQRLEYIQEQKPNYPGLLEKLAQIPTSTPLPYTPGNLSARSTQRVATIVAIRTASPTALPPTSSPTLEPTFTSAPPRATPVFLGTSLPGSQPVGKDNFGKLEYVGQWGKGNILAMAASPDGSAFVVGSAFGMAIYHLQDLQSPPTWVMFETPFVYENLFFSPNGQSILLENGTHQQIRSYPDGKQLQNQTEPAWLRNSQRLSYENTTAISPDGKLKFVSSSSYSEENMNIEYSVRKVFNAESGDLKYELPDETIYVQYNDHHNPEGCDLSTFSMCGNVYDPSASTPYRVSFGPTSKSLTVLYRASNLWNSNQFSTLRAYDLENGKLLNMIGSFDHPVETFAYIPDGRLAVGFVNGSVEIWDPGQEQSSFSAWHFNAPIDTLSYSTDGKYLYIQRQGELEVRRTTDGALFKRYEASDYAISPVENLVAIADEAGNIRLQTLDGQGDRLIEAHKASIYAMAFSPDGKMLVTAGRDCAIRAWDVQTGAFLHPFEKTVVNAYGEDFTASRIFINYFKFIPGTKQLLGFGSWGTVVSWNIDSGATNYVITSEALDYYQGMVTLNPHFPEFFGVDLTGSKFYINEIGFDLATGEKLAAQEQPASLAPGCYLSGPASVDGALLFTIGYDTHAGQICILDAKDYHLVGQMVVVPQSAIFEDTDPYHLINWLFISPDGRQLIVDTVGGAILVYQVLP